MDNDIGYFSLSPTAWVLPGSLCSDRNKIGCQWYAHQRWWHGQNIRKHMHLHHCIHRWAKVDPWVWSDCLIFHWWRRQMMHSTFVDGSRIEYSHGVTSPGQDNLLCKGICSDRTNRLYSTDHSERQKYKITLPIALFCLQDRVPLQGGCWQQQQQWLGWWRIVGRVTWS